MAPGLAPRGIFGYREYLGILRALEGVAGPAVVDLDLSQVRFAHANGMAPTVATIQSLAEVGWRFDVVPPEEPFLKSYFEKAGWMAGIMGVDPPPPDPKNTYVPLTPYDDGEALNSVVNCVIEQLASTTALEGGVLDAIGWSLNEVADNVLNHAGSNVTGWLQMVAQPKKSLVEIVVVDRGRGIFDSLRGAYPALENDRDALCKAIEAGVTRDPAIGQGNGLAGTVRLAVAANGWTNIHSGAGSLRIMEGRTHVDEAVNHQGTLVELTIPTDREIDVASALWGYEPMHELELKYVSEDGEGVLVRLVDEVTGFGNRASARPLRMKVRNLLTQFPDDVVTLDFEGATIISASFADEFVARLVKEIGPTRYFSKVRLVNVSELARRTIDAVIGQRLAGG